MAILYGSMLVVLLLAFLIQRINKKRYKRLQLIEEQIEQKTILLSEITNQINEQTFERSTAYTKSEINALKIYEKSNIQIPVDILDEMKHQNLKDENEIIDFIENQRYYWKLENTKKPFKRKVTK